MTNPLTHRLGRDPEVILSRAYDVILPSPNGRKPPPAPNFDGSLHVGVDLGTAYTVLAVLDQEGIPIAGEYRFTQVASHPLFVTPVGIAMHDQPDVHGYNI